MRDLLAHARRWGLAALAATAATLALAAVASGTITYSVGAPATSGSADSTTGAQSSDLAENQTPAAAACPTCAFAITTTSLPTPVLNQVYGQTIAASGGVAPISFTISAGSLPAGLSLAGNGAITGTPAVSGPYSFTVKATDSSSGTATQTYSGTIAGSLAITTTSLPTPALNQAYSQTITATGGVAPVTFTVSAGSLPAGLSFAASVGGISTQAAAAGANGQTITTARSYSQTVVIPAGTISGTPTAPGAYSFTVKAADANGATAAQTYSGTIATALAITTTSLPTPALSQPYDQTIAATGGVEPVGFTVSGGKLPAGLYLASGVIAGTPTAAGAYSFTVKAADAKGSTATQTYTGAIAAALAITTASLPTPALNQPYSQTIAATGGAAPISFSVSDGTLPAGLSLAANGALTGTPTALGAYSFAVKAADSSSNTATQTYSGTIAELLAITTASLPAPALKQPYDQSITATGGVEPVRFTVSSGRLPAGLYLASGVIAGTPTATGAYSFTLKAADAKGATATQTYSGTVAESLAITTTSLPTPVLNQAYSQTIAATGGAAPISFSVSDGTLPAGLSLAGGGIAGTPTAAGTYSFTVKAADANGSTATQTYTGAIASALVANGSPATPTNSGAVAEVFAITTTSLPTPVLNQAYDQTITAAGGAAPISFSVSDGTLPAGLSLAGGAIVGTPTAAGAYSFAIKAADANGSTATQTYAGAIAGALAIATASLPTPVLDQAYSQTIAASGGVAPISFSVSDGSLPAGLSLAASGAISGAPTAAGAYSFTVKAADANGAAATQTYTGAIAVALAANAVSTTVAYNSTNNPIALDVSGGQAARVVVSTQAGHGVATARGTSIAYTPTRGYVGSDSFEYMATNATGASSPSTVSITVNPQAPIARSVREAVAANSTDNPINLGIVGGPADSVAVAAPATRGAATASGTSITYTPNSDFTGSDSFQYTATNAGGTSKAATVSVTVVAPAVSRAESPAASPAVSDEARGRCAAADPETSIAGCTMLIQSGQLQPADLAVAYNNRGMAYDAQRQYDKAISNFTGAIAIQSDVGEVYFNRGVAYDGKGQTDQAIADYSRAIALKPDDAGAYIRRGNDYRGKGLADEAIADFTQAIRLRPNSADAYDDRAAAYSSTGRAEEAISDLTQAIGLKPNFAQAYVDRGAVYMHKGLFDQAIADSTEAVKLKPNDAGAYINRAAAYIGSGLYDQAIADATRAIALEPDDALAYNNRAVAENHKALFDQAIADATQAIALRPDYALAYLNRAIAEDARGHRDQAIADLRATLKIDPTLQVASKALARLGAAP